ncbi:MAG: NAD(P)H-dependent flavin oxidoreductase [Candidatus Helarchaeales archaeon]
MKWKTRITEMTGTKYPIIQGAFAMFGTRKFAAPVSEAGGLGIITAHNFQTARSFQKELEKMKELTQKPFGVNFSIAPPGHRRLVPEKRLLEYVDIALDEGVKIITTSAYKAAEIGKKVHARPGRYWFHKCATMKHALSAQKDGADAITIVGLEGTGFKNPYQNTTLINMTLARKAGIKVPLIAAGGIGDARGFLAALAMGAEAVCFGTKLMGTKEFPAKGNFKQRLIEMDSFDEKFYKKIYHGQLRDSPIASMAVGFIDRIISIKEFIDEVMTEAEQILRTWGFTGDTFKTF